MESDLTRTIAFNKNPANAMATQGLQATTTAANVGATGATGAATTAATTATTATSFLATKAGIILISVVATAVVATAVVVPVVVTQMNDDEASTTDAVIPTNIPEVTVPTSKPDDPIPISTQEQHTPAQSSSSRPSSSSSSPSSSSSRPSSSGGNDEPAPVEPENTQEHGDSESGDSTTAPQEETHDDTDDSTSHSGEEPGEHTGGDTPEPAPEPEATVEYYSEMISLTQTNFLDELESTEVERKLPTGGFRYESCNEKILYGGNNNAINDKYDEILAENNKLIPSSTNYDEIDENGKLLLNGVDTERKLYKHIFSDGLYDGSSTPQNIRDDEKACRKKFKVNPVSTTNYITGLYAPPGEIITIEISKEDLDKIGGSLPFYIGHYSHNNVISINKQQIGIKRVPNVYSNLVIKKTKGYIGSFLGGPIYISNPPKAKQFTVTISGAVPYKHFIFGVTTKEKFAEMENYSAPFYELDVRDSIRYSGGYWMIKDYWNYENIMLNLIFWDKCARTSRQVPSGSRLTLGIHFLMDPCVNSAGALALAYVGNNWCQCPPSFAMALDYEIATKYGVWGHIHELNHHFQRFGFNSVSNEVTNNVINIVEYILYTQLSGLRNAYSNAALTTISGNHNYMNPEYSLKNLVDNPPASSDEIRFYEPIVQAFGPHLFLKVTQYGGGRAGVDLFFESLTKVLKYDFTFYIEKVLNLVISEGKKNELHASQYRVFVPVSSIFQTGRFFTYDDAEVFSNTTFPYRIPRGGPTKLDFNTHLIYPTGFTATIKSLSSPLHGTLENKGDKVYTYTPTETDKLSGQMVLTVNLKNTDENIDVDVKLAIEFEVDDSQSVQTNYIYDSIIYTDLDEAINNNFEGYSSVEFFPVFSNVMTGIKEGNVGVWEGKFRIDDDGYTHIVYLGGRGPSKLFITIKSGTNTVTPDPLYITINQGGYMFAYPSYAYYSYPFKKGDIVTFKAILLGKTIANGGSASLYIGLSKNGVNARTLAAKEIVGKDSEFDVPYKFDSGDPYYSEKQFDSLSFFDYSEVKISSPNYQSWDGSETNGLQKLIDRNTNTYIHTKRNTPINERNPLTIYFDLGKNYNYNYIYFVKKGPNNYAPRTLTLAYSLDNTTWTTYGVVTTVNNGDLIEINLDRTIQSRYVRMNITVTTAPNPGYIALISVEFIEKGVSFSLRNPEYAQIKYVEGQADHVKINFKNFPYFGHSYILKALTTIDFHFKNTTGIRIKTCNKNDAIVNGTVTQGDNEIKKQDFIIKEDDTDYFSVTITGLARGDYDFHFKVSSGIFDFEYILYEN